MLNLTIKDNEKGKKESLLNINLQKAVKATGITFTGTIIGTIITLIISILIARFYTVGEFGLYGLGIFVITFFLQISTLGIDEGCPRFISFYRGKKDSQKIKGMINSSLLFGAISSSIAAISMFLLSDFLADEIFNIEGFSIILKIFAIALPFWLIIKIIVSIFRGFESVKEQVIFTSILFNFSNVPILIIVIYLDLPFYYVVVSFTLSVVITCFISIYYFIKKLPNYINEIKKVPFQTRPLLSFSWPLIFTGMGWFLISGADKVMIGIYLTEVEVGLYNVAYSLGSQFMLLLTVTVFIFQPIGSRLYAENKLEELKRIFQILTKWLFTITFPFMIIVILFPEAVISLLFGDKYLMTTTAFQLISIAYFTYVFLGPNGATITVYGKTKIKMLYTLTAGGINIFLNYFLIPIYGIEGAAISSMLSLTMINLSHAVYLYKLSGIHPIRKKFVIPIIITLIILLIFYYLVGVFHLENIFIVYKIIICVLISILYFVTILLSKSFDEEDLQLLYLLEKRTGIHINFLKKIIDKFI